MDPHFTHARRCEGLHHEVLRGIRIGNDVHFLAPKFSDDHANARTARANAGADRVHVRVVGRHCDLGPMARLARHRAQLNNTVEQLGHFQFEEPLHESRVRT